MNPIPAKAQIALNHPDKCDMRVFDHPARFEASVDDAGVLLLFEQTDDPQTCASARVHVDFCVIDNVLRELTKAASEGKLDQDERRRSLACAAEALHYALLAADERDRSDDSPVEDLSPMDEVRLLHLLE